jgi:imidazolonepropionase-like amidohydrolase
MLDRVHVFVDRFLQKDELKAAIDAAHGMGLKVTGHLCSIGFIEAAQLGIDHLEHGLFVDTEVDIQTNTSCFGIRH